MIIIMSLIPSHCLLLLLFSLPFFFTVTVSFEPRNQEVEALTAVREGLTDPHGALSNWDENSVDPCSWSMITCNSDNLVTAFGAPSQGLSGSLSWMISNLTNLKQIMLQNNNISGHIPKEIGYLPNLQTLDLSNNKLSGHIPESLGLLNHLQYMLNNNTLSGPVPLPLASLPRLTFLDLSFNNLSGPVSTFPTKTFNILGNPLICGSHSSGKCSESLLASPLSFDVDPSSGRAKTKKFAIALGVSLTFVSILVLVLGFLFHIRNKKRKQSVLNITDVQEEDLIRLGNLKNFTIKELRRATNNFSSKNILGAGGFGNVYRGKLEDGTLVAVKRLKDLTGTTGISQFRTELEMISLAVHRNLLRIFGYCATQNERLLVYPYMSNGSVASRLRGKPELDWNMRKRIAIGASRGLLYLHEQCDPKIIHRDVKAANVLLDDYYEAVVGDFGLAKLLDHAESHVTTAVRGTVGHIAPEYLSTGQSSEKTDVFGFGILLLELITGMRALEFGKTVSQKGAMLEWVKKVQQEKKMELLVDKELGMKYDRIEVGEMLQVALLCTQYLPAHRPKMSDIVRMLEGDGLAEKWAASHNLVDSSTSNSKMHLCTTTTTAGFGHDQSSVFGMEKNMDDDCDANCMELSGPR
ncbi:probable LRR receptor-like serine/threonine-protein kinase At2g23950 isoform X2 [Salvia miltiorrhiza]|uniref:probable LRR receptor-like serine/threonine-protein kinase At2g23950 isoform X2 n=1 Tax=Salvia miltiorrhiza TaxID=226208 RepID=UPI0025ABC6CD|nr:probable LRR receptor-like serine/threonine-protein kinase At2g23950 isoform X2 [Salvia miltiorrhiza]